MTTIYTCHMGGPEALRNGHLQFQTCGRLHTRMDTAKRCSQELTEDHREQEWLRNMSPFEPVMRLISEGVHGNWRDPWVEVEDADLP